MRIRHKWADCVGCDACVQFAPDYFEMDDSGCARLVKPSKQHGPLEFGAALELDRDDLEQAAEACSVQIISLE